MRLIPDSFVAVMRVIFKPPSGREGDHEVVEGVSATLRLSLLHLSAFSLTRLRRELPPGGSLSGHSADS